MDIIVVGGSLGGLLAGVALKKTNQGHKIRILEKSSMRLHDQGAGLLMGTETGEFFKRFDSSKTQMSVDSHFRHYLALSGEESSREDLVQRMGSYDMVYNVLRWNFDGDCDEGYVTNADRDMSNGANGDLHGSATYSQGCTLESLREVQGSSGKTVMEVTFTDETGATQITTADIVVGADGPSSTIRSLVDPSATREYVGYVVWRGTCPEVPVSDLTRDTMINRLTFYHGPGTQALAYAIPGPKGSVEQGKRILNWAWYCNYPDGSDEYKELMTDTDGNLHRITLPPGKMNPGVWKRQKEHAARVLPPQFAELVARTQQPFVQTITDVISKKSSYYDGKVILIGDALAGFRPHTGASTSQAAYDSMLFHDVLIGELSMADWELKTMDYATEMQSIGVNMGTRSQFSDNPIACAYGGRR